MDNCFYCQGLKNYQPQKGGKCGFCGVYNNPLYSVDYQGSQKFLRKFAINYSLFCCGCAWWQFPRNEKEKEEEEKWYQKWKNKTLSETKKTINAN